jgi:hypothetical protein
METKSLKQLGPCGRTAAVLAGIRQGRRRSWPGRWGKRQGDHHESDGGQNQGWGGASEGVQRCCSAVVARSPAPVSWPSRQGHKRLGELLEEIVVAENASSTRIRGRDGEPVVGGGRSGRRHNGARRCVCSHERRGRLPFIGVE